MKTSPKVPAGHPNDWPLADKNAFTKATLLTSHLIEEAGETFDMDAPDVQLRALRELHECVERAVELCGLDRTHWLVDQILAGQFGCFYDRASDAYLPADAFVQANVEPRKGLKHFNGSSRKISLDYLGPETVAWAKRLAAGEDGS